MRAAGGFVKYHVSCLTITFGYARKMQIELKQIPFALGKKFEQR
jgi:hypothetical protein